MNKRRILLTTGALITSTAILATAACSTSNKKELKKHVTIARKPTYITRPKEEKQKNENTTYEISGSYRARQIVLDK